MLTLALQSICESECFGVDHYEALIRVSGSKTAHLWMVEEAESSNLIHYIDLFALSGALAAMDAHPGIRMSVNVSAYTAEMKHDDYLSIIQRYDRSVASRLIVEITERRPVVNWTGMMDFLTRLRAAGVRIAVDDYGAKHGFSEVDMKRLEPDHIKLDGCVMSQVVQEGGWAPLASTLDYARERGIRVVAEHIDSQAKLDAAYDHGIHLLQGYALDDIHQRTTQSLVSWIGSTHKTAPSTMGVMNGLFASYMTRCATSPAVQGGEG